MLDLIVYAMWPFQEQSGCGIILDYKMDHCYNKLHTMETNQSMLIYLLHIFHYK